LRERRGDPTAGQVPKVYRVKGKFLMGTRMQPFSVEMVSTRPEAVRERVYSEFGSRHGVKRNRVRIESMEEIAVTEAVDPAVRYMAGEQVGK
jgi:large subunit ribosomal protein LX